jgi:hypothetical protein
MKISSPECTHESSYKRERERHTDIAAYGRPEIPQFIPHK